MAVSVYKPPARADKKNNIGDLINVGMTIYKGISTTKPTDPTTQAKADAPAQGDDVVDSQKDYEKTDAENAISRRMKNLDMQNPDYLKAR